MLKLAVPLAVKPPLRVVALFTNRPPLLIVIPTPFTLTPPDATLKPLLMVAPAFRKTPAAVVKVLLTDVALLKTTCVGDIVFPPQLNVPVPDCVKLPSMVAVESAMVDGIPALPGGGYGAPLIDETPRLEIATAGMVAVGWITGTHWPNIWIDEALLVMYRGSPTERTQYVPAGTPWVVLVSKPGVVRGSGEMVVRKTLLTAEPIVENWSCVEPLIVWKMFELTPPLVRAVTRATAPVARAAPPKTAPRPCEAAPPTRPCMTSPRPRFTLLTPKSVRVDVRVTCASMEIVLRVDATKLGAFNVLTFRVEKFPVTAWIVFVDMLTEEMEVASKYGVLMKSVAV